MLNDQCPIGHSDLVIHWSFWFGHWEFMRWLTYFILAYLTLGLQIGLAGHIALGGARPNLVLLAVIFIAINAPRDAALLGCFVLGLLQDLTTQQPLGIFALSYGLVAMFTISTQQI